MAGSVWRVRDELWEAVRPLITEHPPGSRGGRPRVDDRLCFNAIVFVLFTGIAWRHLPAELDAHQRPHTGGLSQARPGSGTGGGGTECREGVLPR
jgi:transposase